MGSIFAHTFLVLGGEGPSLRIVAPEETMQRKKRPHRVSPRRFLYPLLRIRHAWRRRVGLESGMRWGPEKERGTPKANIPIRNHGLGVYAASGARSRSVTPPTHPPPRVYGWRFRPANHPAGQPGRTPSLIGPQTKTVRRRRPVRQLRQEMRALRAHATAVPQPDE